jgi:DNA-directed RNA polymerase specialized sigma24 family protein
MPMKTKKSWTEDVEDLVERSSIEEASSRVWERFESALGKLDPQSASLFSQYLDGVTQTELAHRSNLTESQINTWIEQIKRDVVQNLRQKSKVRQ